MSDISRLTCWRNLPTLLCSELPLLSEPGVFPRERTADGYLTLSKAMRERNVLGSNNLIIHSRACSPIFWVRPSRGLSLCNSSSIFSTVVQSPLRGPRKMDCGSVGSPCSCRTSLKKGPRNSQQFFATELGEIAWLSNALNTLTGQRGEPFVVMRICPGLGLCSL